MSSKLNKIQILLITECLPESSVSLCLWLAGGWKCVLLEINQKMTEQSPADRGSVIRSVNIVRPAQLLHPATAIINEHQHSPTHASHLTPWQTISQQT